jgi:hypothetical protein
VIQFLISNIPDKLSVECCASSRRKKKKRKKIERTVNRDNTAQEMNIRNPLAAINRLKLKRPIRPNAALLTTLLAVSFIFILTQIASNSKPANSASWNVFNQINQFRRPTTTTTTSNTQKFLVRDWSVYLGWNNFRYTIETGLLLAHLLNRTLVLPAFTYSRACEYDEYVPHFVQSFKLLIMLQ